MLTLNEFTEGMGLILEISPQMLAKIYAIMDVLEIGMVNFDQFKQVIESKVPRQLPNKIGKQEDGF